MNHENQTTIGLWAEQTFGPAKSNMVIAARANREMGELLSALAADDQHPGALEEIADVVIVLSRIVHRMGGDLQDEIDRTMAINRARKWHVNADGTGEHIKAAPTPLPERPEVEIDPEADDLEEPSLLIDSRTCDSCQHGYQFEPGKYGCGLHMARLCKPSLVGKHWAPRYITRGRETA